MSKWDVDYHLERLKYCSGRDWEIKVSGDELPVLSASVAHARALVGTIRSAIRLLGILAYASFFAVGFAIPAGILGLFATVGPTVALVLGGLTVGATALAAKLAMALTVLPSKQEALLKHELQYRAALEKVVAS